jgi:ketosteroid isomerase-like protein
MRRIALAAFALIVLAACQPATTEFTDAERAAIRDTVTQLADAVFATFRALDVDGFMAPYGSEVIWSENGVLGANRDSLVGAWSGVFAGIQEVTSGDWGEVHVDVLGPDAAVFTAAFDWTGVDTSEAEVEVAGVWTTIWARTDEGWKIIHGHESLLPLPPDSIRPR